MPAPFAYIGQGLSVDAFRAYVASYDFGTIPPDYVVLHHTANPAASWAPAAGVPNWDRSEDSLSAAAIYTKRKAQLDAIMRYYRDTKGWDAGPHLFIDERYIWIFTPMDTIGIHAAEGNSYHDAQQHLHYSIGIEVIGDYTNVRWPEPVAHNVAMVAALLKQRLQNFAFVAGPWAGKVSGHRDYNKPSCPGNDIWPSYYLPLFQLAYTQITTTTRRYRAGPFGAVAHQDRRPDAKAAASWMPGETLLSDDLADGWVHVSENDPKKDVGFIPVGQLEGPL